MNFRNQNGYFWLCITSEQGREFDLEVVIIHRDTMNIITLKHLDYSFKKYVVQNLVYCKATW